MWKEEFQETLKGLFKEFQQINPAFSYRAFARRLGISSGALSEVLQGKRGISREKAIEMLERLNFNGDERLTRMKTLIEGNFERHREVIVSGEDLKVFLNSWVYPAILHFYDQDEMEISVDTMANRLRISHEKVKRVVHHLFKMKLLEMDEDGHIRKVQAHFTTGDEIPSPALKAAHREGFKVAEKALEKVSVENRDFTSLVFAGNPDQIKQVKSMIREFHESVEVTMSQFPRSEVYRLQIQLFPLTAEEKAFS